jgi:hypothetical protein
MGNLGNLTDWFIEENLSYIKDFGWLVPPHALPQFLPNKMVCREVVYQTVARGINKDLKVAQKKYGRPSPFKLACLRYCILATLKVRSWIWRMLNWLTSNSRNMMLKFKILLGYLYIY